MPSRDLPPLITLLTDFGDHDHFVAAMKGIIAGIAPSSAVIDICHQVSPYNIAQARFLLSQSWPYFPQGSVHVAVVDPGVGSLRRGLLVSASGHHFVGPDNGLFTDLFTLKGAKVRHLTNRRLWRAELSTTFHGRDVFAPASAHLANGTRPSSFGPLILDPASGPSLEPTRTGKRTWVGEVIHIDRFGNLITNLSPASVPEVLTRAIVVRVGFREIHGLTLSYSAAGEGIPSVLLGSSGRLEIFVNQGEARSALGCGLGAPVELEVL